MKSLIRFFSVLLLLPALSASADGITFNDIATDPASGLQYMRTPSPRNERFDLQKLPGGNFTIPRPDFRTGGQTNYVGYLTPIDVIFNSPIKPRGIPGVVIFDYDNDGDQDLYVTNGPGTPNSLFSNQLMETGEVSFVDVAGAAGVTATAQDSAGAVAGDIDNDGDMDLYVLGIADNIAGISGDNILYENNGNGTFIDITATSGSSTNNRSAQSATIGDVNGDGLLDIFVANGTDFNFQFAIFDAFPRFPGTNIPVNEHNQLLVNQGNNTFVDVSATSGVNVHSGFTPGFENEAVLSHITAMVDYDQDGDLDIFVGDDQGAVAADDFPGGPICFPPPPLGNCKSGTHGIIHLFENDGTGNFLDVAADVGLNKIGGWMGIDFADFNADGTIDLYGSNFGSYSADPNVFPIPILPGQYDSRWFLQDANRNWEDPGIGDINAIPFGWGAATLDFDNDGDFDVIMHGGLDLGPLITTDNPGVLLENDGSANFMPNLTALAGSTNHNRRIVHGTAVGDLNNDGFTDIVSVSNHDVVETLPNGSPLPLAAFSKLGSVYDPFTIDPDMLFALSGAMFIPTFLPFDPLGGSCDPTNSDPDLFCPNPDLLPVNIPGAGLIIPAIPNGSLSVELNSADNENNWVAIDTVGSVGIASGAQSPRDGIGAVVEVTPQDGATAIKPVIGGASFASQNSLTINFGLGEAKMATVDILWPGGVRNRLYNVKQSSTVVFPEIPCSIDANLSSDVYAACVNTALDEIVDTGIIGLMEAALFRSSALRAFAEEG